MNTIPGCPSCGGTTPRGYSYARAKWRRVKWVESKRRRIKKYGTRGGRPGSYLPALCVDPWHREQR